MWVLFLFTQRKNAPQWRILSMGGDKVKIKGDLQKQLNKITEKAKSVVEGQHSLNDVLNDDFISKHSKFSTLDELLNEAPTKLDTNNVGGFENEKFNVFISENTDFSSWKELFESGKNDFGRRKLTEAGFKLK